MMAYPHGVADDKSDRADKKAGRLGPIGEAVRANVKRIREDSRGLSQVELSNLLGQLGRRIPPLGIYRIEAGERRVDVDDLVALAVALDTSPVSLLMPQLETVEADEQIQLTEDGNLLSAKTIWEWLRARDKISKFSFSEFVHRSWPAWERELYEAAQQEAFDALIDDLSGVDRGDDQ